MIYEDIMWSGNQAFFKMLKKKMEQELTKKSSRFHSLSLCLSLSLSVSLSLPLSYTLRPILFYVVSISISVSNSNRNRRINANRISSHTCINAPNDDCWCFASRFMNADLLPHDRNSKNVSTGTNLQWSFFSLRKMIASWFCITQAAVFSLKLSSLFWTAFFFVFLFS